MPSPHRVMTKTARDAAAASRNDSASTSDWSLAAYLASPKATAALTAALATALLSSPDPAQTELEYVLALGATHRGNAAAGRAHVLRLLEQGGALQAVALAMWDSIEELKGEFEYMKTRFSPQFV